MWCPHLETDEVRSCVDDALIGRICVACYASLEAWWGCEDCEYADIRAAGQAGRLRVMVEVCDLHLAIDSCEGEKI